MAGRETAPRGGGVSAADFLRRFTADALTVRRSSNPPLSLTTRARNCAMQAQRCVAEAHCEDRTPLGSVPTASQRMFS